MEGCIDAGSGSGGSSIVHDLLLIAVSSVATCVAIAGYNYYIDRQVEDIKNEDKKKEAAAADEEGADENLRRPGALRGLAKQQASTNVVSAKAAPPGVTGSIAAALAHTEGGMEASGRFLSAVLSMLWDHASDAISNTVLEVLEPILADLPVSLRFTKFDLGDVPIITRNMFIHRADDEQDEKLGGASMVQIDFDVDWNGECDIALEASIKKITKVTFGVRHFKLSGRMHLLLGPLTRELPVTSAVQFGFIDPPEIELEYTGAAQSLTDKLSFVDIKTKLVEVIRQVLAGVLCLPNRMIIPVNPVTYNYFHAYRPPVGMVRLAAVRGRGFKVARRKMKITKDIPDVYCEISLGASGFLGKKFRTSTKRDALSPSWEGDDRGSGDMILYDVDQTVYLQVYDEDRGDSDDFLGEAEISVRDLFGNEGRSELELIVEGEKTGCYVTMSGELFHLSYNVLDSHASPQYGKKDQLCGLVTIIVAGAFDIPLPKEDAGTYVKVTYGEGSNHEKEFFTAPVVDCLGIDSLNPLFNAAFHMPLSAAMLKKRGKEGECDIVFELIDGDGANKSKGLGKLGTFTVTHESLLGAKGHVIEETRPIGEGGAKVEFRVALSGVQSEQEKMRGPTQGVMESKAPQPSPSPTLQAIEETPPLAKVPQVSKDTPLVTKAPQASEKTPLLAKAPQASKDTPLLAKAPQASYHPPPLAEVQPSPSPPVQEEGGVASGATMAPTATTIRVTAASGRGFQVKKHRLRKDDVPDVYCKIRLIPGRGGGAPSKEYWRTSTIMNNTAPVWNESKEFYYIYGADPSSSTAVVHVEAWEANKTSMNDHIGTAEFSVERLLSEGTMEAELHAAKSGGPMDAYVTLKCIRLG